MKVHCPKCGEEYSFTEVCKDRDLLAAMTLLPEFMPHSKLVLEYVALFGAVRPIKAAKLLRLLRELHDVWKSGRFGFNHIVHTISRDGMGQAFKTVCNQVKSPLTNHNYLKKVMVTLAEEEARKRSARAEAELKEKEIRLRGRGGGRQEGDMPTRAGEVAAGGRAIPKGVNDNLPWNKKDDKEGGKDRG